MTHCSRAGTKPRETPGRRAARRSSLVLGCLVILAALAPSTPAWAHGAGETTEGYALVQQALGHLAHDSGHAGVEGALEKVNDALETEDQEGVAVAEVTRAQAALEADDVGQARTLLQHSILAATSGLEPAVGEETGTTVVRTPMAGRGALNTGEWALGAVSLLMVLAGGVIAFWFRPKDNVRQLRRRLNGFDPLPHHANSQGHRP